MYQGRKLWSETDVPGSNSLILGRCTGEQHFDPKQMYQGTKSLS